MLRYILIVLVLGLPGFARQSLVTTSTGRGFTIPNTAPFNAITDTRLEFRMKIALCTSGAASDNVLRLRATGLGLGCAITGSTALSLYNGSTLTAIPHTFAEGDWYSFRLERQHTAGTIKASWWRHDGTNYGTQTINLHASVVASPNMFTAGASNYLIGAQPGYEFAWIRWYSTLSSSTDMPVEAPSSTAGMIERWEFEGNLTGDIAALNLSGVAGVYQNPDSAFTVTATASMASPTAGLAQVLNAGASFAWDGSTLRDFTIQQISGPSRARISNRRSPTPTVTGLVDGRYVFRVTIKHAGETTSSVVNIDVTNKDDRGFELTKIGSWQMAAKQITAKALGATSLTVHVRRPDGEVMSFPCPAPPDCAVRVDNRSWSHEYRVERTYANGKKSPGAWMKLDVEQIPSPLLVKNHYNDPYIHMWGVENQVYSINSAQTASFISRRTSFPNTGAYAMGPFYTDADGEINTSTYTDHSAERPLQVTSMASWANAKGYEWERMLLHIKIDYTANAVCRPQPEHICRWDGMDKFDAFENGVRGVFGHSGGAYTDLTAAAYDATAADVSMVTHSNVYLGYFMPFDEINWVLSTPRSGGTLAVQYSRANGTWGTLTFSSDGTSGLTASGESRFIPPSDWGRQVINGSISKYWIRYTHSGGGTPAVGASIKGDDWRQSLTVMRGWDAANCTHNCSDRQLAYNVNADSTVGSHARFPHQGWTLGVWADNYFIPNVTYKVGDAVPWAEWVVDRVSPFLLQPRTNVLFLDVPETRPNLSSPSNPALYTEATAASGTDPNWNIINHDSWIHARTYLRANYGSYWKMFVNSQDGDIITNFDYHFNEKDTRIDRGGQHAYVELRAGPPASVMCTSPGVPTGCLPVNDSQQRGSNPDAAAAWPTPFTVVQAISDRFAPELSENASVYYEWDRAVRSPMAVLAAYLITANEYSKLMYNSSSPLYFYVNFDNFDYHDATTTWQTTSTLDGTALFPSPSSEIKTVTVNDSTYSDWGLSRSVRMGLTGEWITWVRSLGVWVHEVNPATITDKTVAAKNPTTGDVPINSAMYIGSVNQFDTMTFAMSVLASGSTVTVDYCSAANASFVCTTWSPATVSVDDTSSFTANGTIDITMPGNWVKNSQGGQILYYYRITFTGGTKPTISQITSADWTTNQLYAAEVVMRDYASGTGLYLQKTGKMSAMKLPPLERIKSWGQYFPAMNTDIGLPDPTGYNGGVRNMTWKTASESATLNGVQRRDFQRAIVLFSSAYNVASSIASGTVTVTNGSTAVTGTGTAFVGGDVGRRLFVGTERMPNDQGYVIASVTNGTNITLTTPYAGTSKTATYIATRNHYIAMPGNSIALGGTYYPLRPDGTTGPGISSISLRAAEGAILMKEPIN